MFIPEMLKYSLRRGKPGWGQASKRPVWWPQDVPWANVRQDVRSPEEKLSVSNFSFGFFKTTDWQGKFSLT